jgi:hypothetical protein
VIPRDTIVTEPKLLDLVATSAALRAQHDVVASYAQLWAAATTGLIPAIRTGCHWRTQVDDLPTIAQHFRVTRRFASRQRRPAPMPDQAA